LVDANLEDGEKCDAGVLLATCEAELLELWLPAELADDREPPEELLCEEPEELPEEPELPCEEPPELEPPEKPPELAPPPPPLPPEECCARMIAGTSRIAATTRPESRIKHLPTD
jgi:hypothetical protein